MPLLHSAIKKGDKNLTVAPIQVNIFEIAKNQAPIIAVQISLRKSKGMAVVGSVSLSNCLIVICVLVPDKSINTIQPRV